MPRKKNKVVPKLDMETPSLANVEYFEWKKRIENAKGDPVKLREINEQRAAQVLPQCEQLLLPLLDKHGSPLMTQIGGLCSSSSSPPIAES